MDRSHRFPTEMSAMRTTNVISPRGDMSFKIGLGLITVFAAIEVFLASYYYIGRGFHGSSRSTAVTTTEAAPTATAAPVVAATTAPVATAAPSATAAPAATIATVSADEQLLKEAQDFSARGDTVNALSRLQQAYGKNPGNGQVMGEMAKIYESTGQFQRSNEMWQKVYALGPSAGPIYELADARLKRGVTATPAPEATQAVQEAPPAPAANAVAGIQDGAVFGISEVKVMEQPDPDADTNLTLQISVKKRPNTVIDHTKVKIQVFFYDTVNDRDIKLTDADVNYEWLTPDHDWAGAKPEILAVTYLRSKNKARSQDSALSEAASTMNPGRKRQPVKPPAEPSDAGSRKYLGYIVRIYYNDKLQAVSANPTKLVSLFPPPTNASSP